MAQRLILLTLLTLITSFSSEAQLRFQKKIILPDSVTLAQNSGVLQQGFGSQDFFAGFTTFKKTGSNQKMASPLFIKFNRCLKKVKTKSFNKPNTQNENHLISDESLSLWHYDTNTYFTFNWVDKSNQNITSTLNKIGPNGDLKFSKEKTINAKINTIKGYNYKLGNSHTTKDKPDSIIGMANIPGNQKFGKDYSPPKYVSQTLLAKKAFNILSNKQYRSVKTPNSLSLGDFDYHHNKKRNNSPNQLDLVIAFKDSLTNNVVTGLSQFDTSWVKRFYVKNDSAYNIGVNKIAFLNDTTYFFTGDYSKPGSKKHKIVGFFDSSGHPRDVKILSPSSDKALTFQESMRIGHTYGEFVAISGSIKDRSNTNKSGMIIKINRKGKISWKRKYPNTTYLSDLIFYSVNSLIALGGDEDDAFMIGTDNSGKTGCNSKKLSISSQKLKLKDSSVKIRISNGPSYQKTSLNQANKKASIIDQCTNLQPTAWLPNDTLLCSANDKITLNAENFKGKPLNTNSSFKWNTGETTAKKEVTKAGRYWVTIKYAGCKDSDTIKVEKPEVTYKGIESGDTVCKDGPSLVKAETKDILDTTELNISWETPDGTVYKQDSLLATDSGKYYFRASYKRCNFLDSFKLHKSNQNLTLNLTNDTVLCPKEKLKLNFRYSDGKRINKGADFKWKNGDTVSKRTIEEAGKYWVTASKNGCSVSDTINGFYPKLGIQTTPSNETICPYDSIKAKPILKGFKQPTSFNFQWTLPNNSKVQKDSLVLSEKGKYELSIPNHHCPLRDTFKLNHYPLPKAKAGLDSTICYGDSITLTGEGGVTYRWLPPKYLSNPDLKKPISSPPDTQMYYLITSNRAGCVDTDRVKVNVRAPLNAKAVNNNSHLCQGDTLTLKAKNIKGGYVPDRKIEWYDSSLALVGKGKTKKIHIDSALASKGQKLAYILKLTDGCSNPLTDTVSYDISQKPKVKEVVQPLSGCSPLKVNFSINNTLSKKYTLEWSFPKETIAHEGAFSETFTARKNIKKIPIEYHVKSDSGCFWNYQNQDTVTVSPSPEAKFAPQPDSTSIKDPVIQFHNRSKNANQFHWDFDNGRESYRSNPEHRYDSAGLFQVQLVGFNEFYCKDTFSQQVLIEPEINLYLPNAFSPNQDNLNEVFKPVSTGISNYELTIYNRWGAKIFEGRNHGWDGTYKGKPSPEGTYLYQIQYEFKKKEGVKEEFKSGTLNLIK